VTGTNRKRYMLGTVVGAAFLALASLAWACTGYIAGKLTITGNAGGSGSVTVAGGHGMGLLGGGSICSITGTAKASSVGGSITVTVAPQPTTPATPCPATGITPVASTLPAATYDVAYLNGPVFNKSTPATPSRGLLALDCMPAGLTGNLHEGGVALGTITVSSGGTSAATTFNLPPSLVNSPADESGICISTPGAYAGILGPVNIVL